MALTLLTSTAALLCPLANDAGLRPSLTLTPRRTAIVRVVESPNTETESETAWPAPAKSVAEIQAAEVSSSLRGRLTCDSFIITVFYASFDSS